MNPRALLLIVFVAAGLVGGLFWYQVTRRPTTSVAGPPAPESQDANATSGSGPSTGRRDLSTVEGIRRHQDELTPRQYLDASLRIQPPDRYELLVDAYGRWASDPSALSFRREIIQALARQDEPKAAIALLLKLAAIDRTPVGQDLLWEDLKKPITPRWADAELFLWGRTQMLIESSDRSRRLLASTLMTYCDDTGDELAEPVRLALLSDLMKVHRKSPDPATQAEIHAGIAQLGGERLARLVSSDELEPDPQEAAARHQLMKELRDSGGETADRIAGRLVESASQPGVTYNEFVDLVNALMALKPEALDELEGRAAILDQNPEAREYFETKRDERN